MKTCKNCIHSEVYEEDYGYRLSGEIDNSGQHGFIKQYITNRKCDKIYDTDSITPRLDNEDGYTGVTHIDVWDDFGCLLFDSNVSDDLVELKLKNYE